MVQSLCAKEYMVGVVVSVRDERNYSSKMCSGSEEDSYLRLLDVCITQL